MVGLEDLIQGEAELGDESEDESFDEDTGEAKRKSNGAKRRNGNLDDSSEEESDDDEEAARAVSANQYFKNLTSNLCPIDRYERVSLLKMKRSQRNVSGAGGRRRSAGGKRGKKRKQVWMRRTSI
jgi:hypothetical protein